MPDPRTADALDRLTLADDASWRSRRTDDLFDAVVALPDRVAAERFFRDLCTLGELHDLAQRWGVVRLLDEGRHYGDIAALTGASTATITRIASWLRHGTGGYREALERRRAVEADTTQGTFQGSSAPDPADTAPSAAAAAPSPQREPAPTPRRETASTPRRERA